MTPLLWNLFLAILSLILRFYIVAASNESETSRILKLIRGTDGEYNGEEMLQWHEGKPINVNVSMYIESLANFHAAEMTFDIDFYLKLSWYDKRFLHNNTKSITLTTLSDMNHVWIPDLYFANARTANFLNVIKPNRYIEIGQTGKVYFSIRILVKATCMYNLRTFPFDEQTCTLRTLSYTNTIEYLVAKWRRISAIELNANIDLPEMEIISNRAAYCNAEYTRYNEDESSATKGKFSCLEVELKLRRRPGHYITLTYVPSGIVVIVSWLSFWIDPHATPARITLCFTTFLTLSTTTVATTKALPPVSYITALSIWLTTCTFFVFATLIEFAFVYNISVRANKMTQKKSQKLLDPDDESSDKQQNAVVFLGKLDATQLNRVALRIDYVSRVIFPLAFLIFVIIYSVKYS